MLAAAGEVIVSPGPEDDALEALVILNMMVQVLRSVANVRRLRAEHEAQQPRAAEGVDDIPF
jgi:hypothetical protein